VRSLAERVTTYYRRYNSEKDERAIFACVYRKITSDLAKTMEIPEQFDDPEWVAALAEKFAGRFMAAMDAIDAAIVKAKQAGRIAPSKEDLLSVGPWGDVYLSICNGRGYVFESLVYSMMAHISYDLPQAVIAVGMTTDKRSHIGDYHRMNKVLGEQIDLIEKLLADDYQPTLRIIGRWAGRFGIFFTNYGIRSARSLAWYNADRLCDPISQQEAMSSIKRSTASFIGLARRPPERLLRFLVKAARLLIPRRHRWPKPEI
jgi:hypothetical protein